MKHELKYKDFAIQGHKSFKDDSGAEQLQISGWAARFGNVDSYGDVIQPGAFTKTIQERRGRIAFCLQHEIDEPIGKITLLEERPEGLWVECLISASEGDVQTKIKEGILKEMSIGYCTVNGGPATIEGQEVYQLSEIKLYEISLVTIAANPLAYIVEMKEEERNDFIAESFDRIISAERSNEKKYELMKLKNIVVALIAKQEPSAQDTPLEPEPPKVELSKNEILNLLR